MSRHLPVSPSPGAVVELESLRLLAGDSLAVLAWSGGARAEVALEQVVDQCIFLGRLEEPGSLVLVTGCPGEQRSVQVQSQSHGDTLATLEGGHLRHVKQLHLGDRDYVEEHHNNESLPHRQKREYVENDEFINLISGLSIDVSRPIELPERLGLSVHVHMAPSWTDRFGGFQGGKRRAKEVLFHTTSFFQHSSLDTKINLDYRDIDFFQSPIDLAPLLENLPKLEPHIHSPPDRAGVNVYLTNRAEGDWDGYAKLHSVCLESKPSSISKWLGSAVATGQLVAHEIGHNLGLYHDFDSRTAYGRTRTCGPGMFNSGPDNDLMNYGAVQSKWSSCSNEDFSNFYRVIAAARGGFCLPEPADDGAPEPTKQPQTSRPPSLPEFTNPFDFFNIKNHLESIQDIHAQNPTGFNFDWTFQFQFGK